MFFDARGDSLLIARYMNLSFDDMSKFIPLNPYFWSDSSAYLVQGTLRVLKWLLGGSLIRIK